MRKQVLILKSPGWLVIDLEVSNSGQDSLEIWKPHHWRYSLYLYVGFCTTDLQLLCSLKTVGYNFSTKSECISEKQTLWIFLSPDGNFPVWIQFSSSDVIDNDVGIMSGVFLDRISDFQTNIDGVAIIYQNDGAFFVRLLQAVFESSFEILDLNPRNFKNQ